MPDIITSREGFHGIKVLKELLEFQVGLCNLAPNKVAVPKQQVTRGLGTTL